MANEAQLTQLERLHRALEQEIAAELTRPGSDDLRVAEMKRRKLQLKDQIERMRHDADSRVH